MRISGLDKWATGEKRKVKLDIVLPYDGHGTVDIISSVNKAPMGDFMEEYIKHLTVPWYRRGPDWRYINRKLKQVLNQITMEWVSPT